jgi:glycosyltransferase involved in cell wall biosynthesis
MRVLIVVPTLATYPFLRELCQAMVERGWEVHWASSNFRFEAFEQQFSQIHYHPIEFPRGANPLSHWKAAGALNKLMKEIQPDVVDVHFSAAMLTTALAIGKFWPPTVATVHGLRFPLQTGWRKTVERLAECWAARRMNKVVLLTNYDYQALHPCSPSTVEQLQSTGIGCRLDQFDRSSVTAARQALAVSNSKKQPAEIVLIYVGRKVAFKGFDTVLRSFLLAQQQLPNLRLIVCGNSDPFHPSGLTTEEENELANHPQITQLGWIDRVADYLSISDITLFPSRREGMPVNLMESLAMGVPVITCNSRGCRDVVDHEVTGLVLPDFDVKRFSDAIVRLASDPALRAKFSANALAIRERFDRQKFVDEHTARLERLATS